MLLDCGTSAGVSDVRLRLGEESKGQHRGNMAVDNPTSRLHLRVQRTPTQVTLHLLTALGGITGTGCIRMHVSSHGTSLWNAEQAPLHG